MGITVQGQGPEGPQGGPGPEGPQGPAGTSGSFLPVVPSATPNTWTFEYLFRVSANKSYDVDINAEVARLDSRKTAKFRRILTIEDDGAGNAKLPFGLVDVAPDRRATGAQGMTTAQITQQIAPGDPASVLITVSGPNGTTCRCNLSILTTDGVDLV